MKTVRTAKKSYSFLSKLVKGVYLFVAVLILLFAVLVTIARLATPYVNKDLKQIERYLSDEMGKPVHIGKVDMWWNALGPTVKLENLDIDNQIRIQSLDLDLNLINSLYYHKLVISNIVIMGGSYNILQLPNHGWVVNGVQFFEAAHKKSSLLTDLFSFADIAVKNVHIYYTNLKQDVFSADIAYLHLNNTSDEHSLSGVLNLLEPYRVPFRFNLRLSGDVDDLNKVRANLYLETSNLLLSHVFPQKIFHGQQINSGFADAELWLDWQDSQVQRVQTQFDITDLELSANEKILLLPQFSANAAWLREKTGWSFSADRVLLDVGRHVWPVDSLYVEKQAQKLRVGVAYLSLFDLYSVLTNVSLLTDKQLQQLSAFKPAGELSNLIVQRDGGDWSFGHLRLSSVFKDIAIPKQQVIPAIPAMTHLSGQLYWQQDHGNIFINTRNVSFEDDSLFVKPLVFQRAYVDVSLQQKKPDLLSVVVNNVYLTNQDVHGFLQGLIELSLTGKAPVINLLSTIQVDDLSHVYNYLPVGVMTPEAKGWFRGAFEAGNLTADMLFRGNLDHFPFRDHVGTFLAVMTAHQVQLRYSPKWPSLFSRLLTANIVGDNLMINAPEVSSRKIIAKNLSAKIPAMTQPNPYLTLKLTGTSPLGNMIDIIDHGTLAGGLGKSLGPFHVAGMGTLNLQLDVPLDHTDDTGVVGQLKIQDGAITGFNIPNSVRKIKGELEFTQHGITAQHVDAVVFNYPAIITADTLYTNAGLDILNVYVQGSVNAAYLESISQLPITQFITGVIPFKACIVRALNSPHDNGAVKLQAQSDLAGVAVMLPGDLLKTADTKREFKLQFNYFASQFSNIKMAYGNLLSFDLDTIGMTNTDKTTAQGFSVTMNLKQVDWSQWQAYFSKQSFSSSSRGLSASGRRPAACPRGQCDISMDPANKSRDDGQAKSGVLNKSSISSNRARSQISASLNKMSKQYHNKIVNINLQVGQVKIYNQEFKNVVIVLQPQRNAWDFNIKSDNLVGDFIWPLNDRPFVGTFSHFHLQPITLTKDAVKSAKINIKQIPVVKLSIEDFSYGNELQGKLLLDVSKLVHGVYFNNMEFMSKLLTVKVTGQWIQRQQTETTSLAGSASSGNFSQFLQTLEGKSDTDFNLSTVNTTFNLTWPSAPYEPVLKAMVGDADLTLGAGNIADIGKNAESQLNLGRLLNALSLQSIAQKLTFNFKDTKPGYNFTSMQGKFTLNSGDLYTKQTQFDGPVASVGFSGHIYLDKRTFDLMLAITPHVTGSVPVVAGLLINPAIGVAAWFANLLFSPAVSQAVAQNFQMTGDWNNPKIVPLANNPASSSATLSKAK